MFHTLRKILAVLLILLVSLIVYWLARQPTVVQFAHDVLLNAHAKITKDEEKKIKFTLVGMVYRVRSGDSFDLATDQGASPVRLAGLTAPALPAYAGRALTNVNPQASNSYAFLQRTAEGKVVTVKALGMDTNRWMLALVELGDQSLNHLVLSNGWARLDPTNLDLLPLKASALLQATEAQARQAQLGLWAPPPLPHTNQSKIVR